jgi:putative FmdB family regulatory protein
MPIYEYTCKDCTHTFSKRRSMSDADAPIDCPICGSDQTNRGLSLFATVGASSSRTRTTAGGGGCSSCSGGSCSSCGH